MAVDNTSAFAGPYAANGTTTVFPFSFCAASTDEIAVTINGMLVDPTSYSVNRDSTGAGSVVISPAPASGELYILSDPDFTQTTTFQRFGPYFPDFINAPLDRSAIRDIYLREQLSRALVAPIGEDLIAYVQSLLGPYIQGATGTPGGNIGAIGPKTGATGMAIPTGVTMVRTSCYATPGDGGQADYTLIGADDTRLPASAKFVDSAGRWWRIEVQGAVHIEQFGGKADCPYANFDYGSASYTGSYAAPNPATVTDNLQPYYDAEKTVNVDANVAARNEVGSMIPILFARNFDTAKCYWFSGTIVPQYATYIKGNGNGGDSIKTGSTFRFPPNTPGIKFNAALTQPVGYVAKGGGYSIVQGIWFQGGGGTTRTAHGFHHRVPVRIWQCSFDSFAGHNILNIGSVGLPTTNPGFGLTSGSHYVNVTCRAAGMWNTWIEGSDVSASQFDSLQHKGSRLGGLSDTGFFGNTYNNYGNHGHGGGMLGSVRYNGRRYALITDLAVGGSTTPGTNDRVWEDRGEDPGGSNPFYPTWVSGGTYALSVPAFITYPNTEFDAYIENYYLPAVGGNQRGTPFPSRYSQAVINDSTNGLERANTQNFGWRYTVPPNDAAFAVVGALVQSKIGGGFGAPAVISGWSNALAPQGWTHQYLAGGRIRVGIAVAGSGQPMAYELLDTNTTTKLGRATNQPGFIVAANFALGNVNGAGDARIHETFNGPPPAAGGRATGEVLFKNDPIVGGALIYTPVGGAMQPVGIVGAVQATGLSSSSTAAQIVAALQAAKLVA